ncbi:MAG: hypothetical protein Q9163_004469 [Psora crenata]
MAEDGNVKQLAEANGKHEHGQSWPQELESQPPALLEDKEVVDLKKDWQEIKVADVPLRESIGASGSAQDQLVESGKPAVTDSRRYQHKTQTPESSRPPSPPPDKYHPNQSPPTPKNVGSLPNLSPTDGSTSGIRQESDHASSRVSNGPGKSSTALSSMVFVVSALEQIAASKEAKRRKPLWEAVDKAMAAIKQEDKSPSPEIIFEPLRLATENTSVPVTTTALDCIGKLISYSYFSIPAPYQDPNVPSDQPQHIPLIDRAIATICDCFQDEATPAETQLQIVKSLLAAVLNDKLIVHGSGLLRAVRQVYNIFLLSKSSANQQVAQGTLTQMVGTVFERVTTRLTMKETRMNLGKVDSEKGTASASQADLHGSNSVLEPLEVETTIEPDASSESTSILALDQSVPKEEGEKLTLESIETAKGFDDRTIADNAPTMVTPAKSGMKSLGKTSGLSVPLANGSDDEHVQGIPEEEEEDEIFVKDAFLVFRSFCRLSHKGLPADQQQDVKSSNMRQKLVSLALIRTTLNNNMVVFTSPLCTIRGSTNSEPTSFGQAINQYLRLSVSRNAASSVRQVFELCAEIFWLMLKDMRTMLKREIELFLKEIYLAILERKNAPSFQKLYVMKILRRLSIDPRALVEIYLNYDCESTALDNMFQRIIEHLSRISSTPALVSAQNYHQYVEQYAKEFDGDHDWHDHGKLPPSLTTASLSILSNNEPDLPVDFLLKHQALDSLMRALRSLVNWSQDSLAAGATKLQSMDIRQSSERFRESLEAGQVQSSPRTSTAGGDTPIVPSTPLLEDDPSQLEKAKLRKTALLDGIRQFNFKPKRGIKTLLSNGFIKSDAPEDIAAFILQNEMLDKAMVGEYLGEGDPQNVAIMHAFVDLMDFTKRRFVDALRQFLQSFRLPGEAQKIDRFMLKFAERYITGNPNAFANADTAYVLAYSVIMLNTDQHSTKLRGKRMDVEDFIKNNRGINDNADLPDEYLAGIYEEIAHNEIVLNTERETAAALGMMPPAPSSSIASRVGQAFLTAGRDLQREAYAQASEEMSKKAEQRLRNIIRSQRRMTRQGIPRFIPATSFKHAGPMFDVTWMSFFSGLLGQMQTAQNIEVIKLCLEGVRLAIRIACLFDLETPRTAFITALASFTNLGNLNEMMAKNFEALKVLLDVALCEGNLLKGSWRDMMTCVSQLDRFQLISGGIDEGAVPDVNKARIQRAPSIQSRRSVHTSGRLRPNANSPNPHYDLGIANESRSSDMIKIVDRIFTSTAELSGDAIVHFVRALSEVSWQEIQSSGQSEAPRTYSLQKLVEISYYNMTRVRFEWSNIWQVLGEHFNDVGCHSNTHVVFFALDSLRQLSMRFMELEELPGFKFQKDFLKPFEHVMANSSALTVKDMVLRCLIQMIQARGENIRSGWKTMFGVFTVAAREPYEAIVNLAYDHVTQVYNTRLGVVISQGAFADLVVCLTEFSKNHKFQKKSLAAIETLKSIVPRMLRTPECPLSHRVAALPNGYSSDREVIPKAISRQTQEEQFWFPVLFAFHDILMTGEDLEVRSQASNYLFDILKEYGGDFPPHFWDILWRQLLYPIFMVLKSKSEMMKVLNNEDLSVWLSTTMIQALRNMITLFTHYFDSLEYMLDRFLDLLALCICQENDTIARIGSNCLQQLILQNVSRFVPLHWHKIVGSFVELFERTTAHRLFQAGASSSDDSQIGDDEKVRRGLQIEPTNSVLSGGPAVESASNSGTVHLREGKINGLPNGVSHSSSGSTHSDTSTPPTPGLEDYRPQSALQQPPVVVTAARRKLFNKIITQCVLQLLMIETVNELFSNDLVYAQIPSDELLRLMALLKSSYTFAKKFNNNKELRMRLWREGFMRQPPNLLKQESGSAACYVAILVRMYHDEGEERRRSRAETEAALIPLCAEIIRSFNVLDETQPRNIEAWRPVVVDVMEGYTNFPREDFEKHIETFYPLGVELLNKENGVEGEGGKRSFADQLRHPFPELREQLKDTRLYDVKVSALHFKNKVGKFHNIINPNHRHDEEHEKETDEKRTRIAESHRFLSFAPEREGNKIKWYVDGRDYFYAVSVALEKAKEVIYIEDWWLSPELFLRRPPYFNQEWRLDQVLKRRAEAGVKIYVIVYKEVEQAVSCNSAHTKHALAALCPEGTRGHGNIKIMRHPDHNVFENAGDMTFYWAHHEKFIVIDYELAFIGGLDLCFGRWDNRQHPLADVHPAGVRNEIFPGQDFNNNRIMDFQTVENWKNNELSKADYGRMPWHDVAMGVIGDCVYDIAEHFILRWNFVKRDKYKRDPAYDWLSMEGREGEHENLVAVQRPKHPVGEYVRHPYTPLSNRAWAQGPQGTVHAQVVRSSADWSSGILTEHSIQNAYCEIIRNAQHFVYIENQFFITATGEDQAPIHNTIGRAIVDACVRAGKEGRKFRVIIVIPAIPGFAGDLRDDAAMGTRAIMDYQYKSINRGEHSIYGQIRKEGVDPTKHVFLFNLRSYDRLNKTPAMQQQEESSGVKYQDVQRAEAEEIMGGGVPSSTDEHPEGKDDSRDEEKERLVDQKRKFEASREEAGLGGMEETEPDTIASTAMLNGGKVTELKWDGDLENEKENFVQEELYIHAKLCIVDDRITICGSSNINDRSQMGLHDSELSIVMEDKHLFESTMDGQPYQAGHHAATLRRLLWREHLGLLPAQSLDASDDPNAQPPDVCPNDILDGTKEYEFVADPLGDEVWDMWTGNATKNTELFRQLFRADPDDNIKTFDDYAAFLPRHSKYRQGHLHDPFIDPQEVREKLDQIKGHLVWMPLEFLKDAEMAEKGLQVNAYTESIYT